MVHLCKIMISPEVLSIFSKFWFFELWRGVGGVKGPKMVQNKKKFCLWHSISQESYIIWFLFMVLMCKMIIFSGFFFIFSKVWFSGLLGGQRVKNSPIWQKIILLCLISQKPYIIWSSFVVHKCKMILSPVFFLFFQKFDLLNF